MPMTPTVRLKFLSLHLREARERAGVEPREVARLLGRDTTRVTKVEKGREGLTPGDARMLLDHFGVHTEEQKREIVELARTRSQRGRWTHHRAAVPPRRRPYHDFEQDADRIRHHGVELVPDLLRTGAYARAALARGGVDPRVVDDLVATVLERQEVLSRPRPARAEFVLSESCLRRVVGGGAVMREQLDHLVSLSRRRAVRLQVLPFDSGGAGSPFAFTALRVPAPTSAPPLDLVYVEHLHDVDYLEGPRELAEYAGLWDGLAAAALGVERSRRFLEDVAREHA